MIRRFCSIWAGSDSWTFCRRYLAGLDDRLARLLAEDLGLEVTGVVGILLKGKRAGMIPLVQPLLDQLRQTGFRLRDDVYREALRLADEDL